MLKTVKVPPQFEPPFARAERFVEGLFADVRRRPDDGTIHVGAHRYVLVRAESLYLTWFKALSESFGAEAAREFIYNTAREIGRADSAAFSAELKLTEGIDRLASGPIHFAHAGWAQVEILADSVPANDANYFLHYRHPNTFESEVVRRRGERLSECGCMFSAGYSSGWCTDAFGVDVHGREIRCLSRGDDVCEFIMAPIGNLDRYEKQIKG